MITKIKSTIEWFKILGFRGYLEYKFVIPFLWKHCRSLDFRWRLFLYTEKRFPHCGFGGDRQGRNSADFFLDEDHWIEYRQ